MHQLTQITQFASARFGEQSQETQNNEQCPFDKRFIVLLSEHNILRVKELVTVALKYKRSISYIVDKVSDAIGNSYRAMPFEEDKDLAFVVLK